MSKAGNVLVTPMLLGQMCGGEYMKMCMDDLEDELRTKQDDKIECAMCGDTFTEADLKELDDMGERYHREDGCFLCPDCWDSFKRMDPEDQAKVAITNRWKEARHGPEHED